MGYTLKCRKCGEFKEPSDYYRQKQAPVQPCKECRK
jgi:hypothetical protein